jgi:hypothetical protein
MLLDNNKFSTDELMLNLNNNGIWLEREEIEDLVGLERGTLKSRDSAIDNVIKIDFKNTKD